MINSDYYFQQAETSDLISIKNLLQKLDLVHQEIEKYIEDFIVLKTGNKLIGCAGLEIYDEIGLLRSVAIDRDFQGKGLGKKLVKEILKYADKKEIVDLYLLTNSAEKFFEKHGFNIVSRTDVDPQIKQTYEYTTGCEETASVMIRKKK